ncbi:hypothetical protein SAMCFNEI73_pC1551 (plasmid) [Sinorhizobium americanum]|uniref:Uncharacterized protein n=1 Tax=Sinorhizobium americanum TaxID=194963 RepID=A0A1L3LYS5_9HYPH|nr:hypothetical protein SAMCFNEI73_pC1551 [Sinorhizobium americanum]
MGRPLPLLRFANAFIPTGKCEATHHDDRRANVRQGKTCRDIAGLDTTKERGIS